MQFSGLASGIQSLSVDEHVGHDFAAAVAVLARGSRGRGHVDVGVLLAEGARLADGHDLGAATVGHILDMTKTMLLESIPYLPLFLLFFTVF